MIPAFEYPVSAHVRRHGPDGYLDYASYRDWLRDEFFFRCVFCLHREQWYGRSGTFDIEHFVPVAIDESGKCEYTNLLYACRSCNVAKRDALELPDPCAVAFGACLRVKGTGVVEALNDDGKRLRDVLCMNSQKNLEQRSRWIKTLKALQISHPDIYREYMAFPNDLPDLRRKKAPRNSFPDGATNCFFVQRKRGALSETY